MIASATRPCWSEGKEAFISGNDHSVRTLDDRVHTIWRKWLRRRSQRTRMTWKRYEAFLEAHPLPKPTVRKSLWG
jgi:hypothetical protein